MRIAVKYCGGCNPRYDRTSIIDRLKKEFDFITIEVPDEGIIYDLIIVLCGCTSKCADYKNLKSKYGTIVITNENEYKKITDKLKEINN